MTYHDRRSADVLKVALLERAEEFVRSLFPNARRDGQNLIIGSLRGEPGRSLSIRLIGPKVGVWRDFATDEGGDNLLELLRAVRGLDFATACREARTWLGMPSTDTPRLCPPHARQTATTYHLTNMETTRGTCMAERLLANSGACEAIARRRGWRPQVVFDLASEASLGLSEAGRLVFLYDTGAKERWRENGQRRMRFLFGKADSLWRGGLLPIAERVDDATDNTTARTGAKFVSTFTKPSRNTPNNPPSLEWTIRTDTATGKAVVAIKKAEGEETVLGWVRDGLTQNSEIAREMAISPGAVSKLAKKLLEAGRLTKEGRNYAPVDDGSEGAK